MNQVAVAIIGAGPYGLSVAAHLAELNIEHRIFGRPMHFWSQVAEAASERYLKSYCFATNISSPRPGFSFVDYNQPLGLPTFEPCSIGNFAAYGKWFQQHNVPWAEPVDVAHVSRHAHGFALRLSNGERLLAQRVIVATGLACFAHTPSALASLPSELVTHTSKIGSFSSFRGKSVAVIGAGQSALEAAALLYEAGAQPQLLVRENTILWHSRVSRERTLWQHLRYPISGLGIGPKAWTLINFPGLLHRMPADWRLHFMKNHLPAEGAWWLRERVENRLPVHLGATVLSASEIGGRIALRLAPANDRSARQINVDHVIAGSGYNIDLERLEFLDQSVLSGVQRLARAPKLNASFETSLPGLHFVGPTSAASFGPLFRFVVGADYTAQVVSKYLAARVSAPMLSHQVSSAA